MIDIFKKSIIYFLCIIFAMSNMTVLAEEKTEKEMDIINIEERIKSAEENGHRYAYITPGNGDISMVNGIVGTNRWNSSQRAEKMPLYDWKAEKHHDKLAIECTASEQSNIFATFSGKYWEEKPISRRLAITVEYVDIADSSFDVWGAFDFPKLENNQDIPFTAVVTEGSNEWKTVTFYLEDNAGRGLRLRTPTIQPLYAGYKTPIGNIFIEEDLGEYPIAFTADNGFAGRIYSFGDSEKMTVSYDNTLTSKISAEVSYNIRDYEGKKVNSGKLNPLNLAVEEGGTQEILTGVTDRGTYTLELIADVEEENGNKHQFTKKLNFSIMDTIEEGEERNPLAALCTGFSANQYHGGYAGGEQILRIPVAKVRLDGMGAANVEPSKGVYTDPILTDRKYFKDNGLDVYVIAMNLQSWYNGGRANNIYPNTKEAHEGYAAYAAYVATLPYVDTIELFNEWNHSGFSPLDQSADGYLEYCKVAYPAIKTAAAEQGKDITVLAGGTAGFSAHWLERFISLGGLDYCDGLSYHPYQSKDFNYKTFKNQTEQAVGWMMKYHGSTKPIHLTEMGMSEAQDEKTTNNGYPHWNKMRSLPGMFIMAQHYDVYETIYYYCKNATGDNILYREPGFGLYRYTGDISGNRLTARDEAITFATYLDKMTGTEPGRRIEDAECTKLAYEFIKKDGSNVAALWTSTQHNTMALKLGTDSINVYDQFGNLKSKLFSPDGCYDFDLTDEIIYIEGNFQTFEEATSSITLSHGVVSGLMGDAVSFAVSDLEGRNLKAELEFDPDIFTFGTERAFKDGKLSLNASLKDGVTGRYHVGVKVFDENQNVIYYARPAIEIGTEMLDVEIDTVQNSPNDTTHWAVAATVKNISSTKTLNGKIEVIEPKEYAGSVRSFSELLPGEERMVKVNLPMMVVKRPQEMTVNVTLDNGVSKNYTLKLDFTSANKVTDKIKIDGKVDFGEWNSTLLAEDRADKYYTLISGTYRAGIEDLSVRHKIMWDEDNFYMMAKVRDNIHYSDQQDLSMMWKDDGIQFGILKNNRETLDSASLSFTELCISDNPSGAKVYRHSSASGKPTGEITNLEVKISRDGGYTIYEMRIPWIELLADEHTAKAGDEYAFSFLVNDNDGAGRKGFMFYNDGIGTSKTPALFGKLRLN